MEEEVIKKESKENYIMGVIGCILGGIVGAIPWLFAYFFGNVIIAIFSVFIAFAAFYGYKLFKGKVSKSLPVIISIVTIAIVAVIPLVIVPIVTINNANQVISIENFKLLYLSEEFRGAIIHDLLISLLFATLGIFGVVANINKQIKSGVDINDIKVGKVFVSEEEKERINQENAKLKEIFLSFNAMSKEKAVIEKDITERIQNDFDIDKYRAVLLLQSAKQRQVVKVKAFSKYYYNEKGENNYSVNESDKARNNPKKYILLIVICVIVGVVIGVLNDTDKNKNLDKTNKELQESIKKITEANDEESEIIGGNNESLLINDITIKRPKDFYLYSSEELSKTNDQVKYNCFEISDNLYTSIYGEVYNNIENVDLKEELNSYRENILNQLEGKEFRAELSEVKEFKVNDNIFYSFVIHYTEKGLYNLPDYEENIYGKIDEKIVYLNCYYPEENKENTVKYLEEIF